MHAAIQISANAPFPEQADYGGNALSYDIDDPESVAEVEEMLMTRFGLSHKPVVHGRNTTSVIQWLRFVARSLFTVRGS